MIMSDDDVTRESVMSRHIRSYGRTLTGVPHNKRMSVSLRERSRGFEELNVQLETAQPSSVSVNPQLTY